MRISDWSSDVCSSDLAGGEIVAAWKSVSGRRLASARSAHHIDGLHILIGRDRLGTEFATHAAGLHPTEGRAKRRHIAIDADRAARDLPRHRRRMGAVGAPHRTAEPIVGIIGNADSLRFPIIGNDSQHRSEEHTSELQSLMRISYAVFCLKKKKK